MLRTALEADYVCWPAGLRPIVDDHLRKLRTAMKAARVLSEMDEHQLAGAFAGQFPASAVKVRKTVSVRAIANASIPVKLYIVMTHSIDNREAGQPAGLCSAGHSR